MCIADLAHQYQLLFLLFHLTKQFSKIYSNFTCLTITVKNCISLLNQIVQIDFSQTFAYQNSIRIAYLFIYQTQEVWNNYLQKIKFPGLAEIKKIVNFNALVSFSQCSVSIQNYFFSGVLISPILTLQDITSLIVQNFQVENSQVLYPFTLFQFLQSQQQISNHVIIEKMLFLNITNISYSEQQFNRTFEIITFVKEVQNCNFGDSASYSFNNNQTMSALINLLHQNSGASGSIISIIGLSNSSRLNINQLSIYNSNCQFCQNGTVLITSSYLTTVKLVNIYCYNNIIQQIGCLQVTSEKDLGKNIGTVIIKNSAFIGNSGTQGIGIMLSNLRFRILTCLFFLNFGASEGGAILINQSKKDSIFKNTQIIQNSARIGGGIVMKEVGLSEKIFVNSSLFLNNVLEYSNNLVDLPNSLDLRINNEEFGSVLQIIEDLKILILDLPDYHYFSQGILLSTNILLLPSNQKILDYKIYDPKRMVLIPYINDFSLLIMNSRNENLAINQGDQCETKQILKYEQNNNIICRDDFIYYINSIIEFTQLYQDKLFLEQYRNQTLTKPILNPNFDNNGYDLGSLTLRFDPYSSLDLLLRIQINCSFANGNKKLYYQIVARTFQCQLGEFFTNEGCSICEPNFGFYSVTYNATKCSIFDKTKFDNITSNQIKLKSGFWRPSYQSDLTENCFKNQEWCLGGWYVNNDLCYPGHIGALCEECDIYNIRGNGNYFKTSNTICVICENGTIIPFIFITIWSLISILLTIRSIRNSNNSLILLKVRTKIFKTIFKLIQDLESIMLKMLLNYLQLFSVIFTFNITFNLSFGIVNEASSPSYFMAINMDCYLQDLQYCQLIYLRIITMILLIVVQILVITIGFAIYSKIFKVKFDSSVISNTSLYLFVQNQATLIQRQKISYLYSLGSLIAARSISGVEFIQGNVSLSFYQSNHLQWVYSFIVPLLGVFGFVIPLNLFISLFFNKKNFYKSSFRSHFCYLYNEYNIENYFWEQIKICKRSLIIIILTYFENNVPKKAFIVSLTMLCYEFLAVNHHPYITKKLNDLDVDSGFFTLAAVFIAAIKLTSEQDDNKNIQILLQVILILLCIRLCYSFILNILKAQIKKYHMAILTNIYSWTIKINKKSRMALFLHRLIKNKKKSGAQLQLHFHQLKQYLIFTSKLQIEQKRQTIMNHSSRHNQLNSPTWTNRRYGQSKLFLLTKDDNEQ